jgi:hypothetical protein
MRQRRLVLTIVCLAISSTLISASSQAQDPAKAKPQLLQFILQAQYRQLDKGIEASPKTDPTAGELLSSIDALVDNQNHSFLSAAEIDKHKLQIAGTIRQADAPDSDIYRLEIRYEDKNPSGSTSLTTTVVVKPTEPFTLMSCTDGRFITVCLKSLDQEQAKTLQRINPR